MIIDGEFFIDLMDSYDLYYSDDYQTNLSDKIRDKYIVKLNELYKCNYKDN